MMYGTVLVVHCIGGLRDTVQNYNLIANGRQGVGTGWTFSPWTKANDPPLANVAEDFDEKYDLLEDGL
ncbi:hypothetical protein Mapa_004600 [Marchantia paleacea]|nr:hypothetical protein Mapa_004600 [Marchantia paleacea]